MERCPVSSYWLSLHGHYVITMANNCMKTRTQPNSKLIPQSTAQSLRRSRNLQNKNNHCLIFRNPPVHPTLSMPLRVGADKSLARPGRKKATATKLGIYSTYSSRSSIHFLARCSNFSKPLKKSEVCLSNQVSVAAMTSISEKWLHFNFFF